MLYAVYNGKKIRAHPDAVGVCDECGELLTAKCGYVKTWHWAHRVKSDCANSENEGPWHIAWKNLFPPEDVEVKSGNFRADVWLKSDAVIELQSSPISVPEIEARENHYIAMVWILDGANMGVNLEIKPQDDNRWAKFRWKWAPQILHTAQKPIIVDLGFYLLWIKSAYHTGRGWGKLMPKHEFVRKIAHYREGMDDLFCQELDDLILYHTGIDYKIPKHSIHYPKRISALRV